MTGSNVIVGMIVGASAALGACAHTSEGPLEVPLGLPREQVAHELRPYDYCAPKEETGGAHETYPRCDNPGIDYRDSWVTVDFDGGRVVRVARWERWDDDARAVERWNQLVAARSKRSAPSEAARAVIAARHALPPGTRSWQAFEAGASTVAAVYLLEPRPPENAAILEEIVGTTLPAK